MVHGVIQPALSLQACHETGKNNKHTFGYSVELRLGRGYAHYQDQDVTQTV